MRQIPNLTKIGFVVMIAYFTTMNLPAQPLEIDSLWQLAWLIIQETLLGLILGYASTIIYAGIQGAGDLIDFIAGLKMSASFDPMTGTSSSIYSTLYNWFAIIIFLFMDGHHYLLKGITRSFDLFQLGQEYVNLLQLEAIVYLVTRSFIISIQIALPIGIILFLIDLILGLISKVIPQLNVFMLGMSLKMLVSFGVHLLILVGVLQAISWALDSVVSIFDFFIRSLM